MKKSYIAVAILVVAAVAAVAIWRNSGARHREDLTHVSYRIKWLPNANYLDGYVAIKKGYFEQQGLTCQVMPGGPDLDSIKLVASGTDHFGVTGADQLLLARRSGAPVVAIAAIFQQSPVCFISHSDAPVTKPADFAGKRVGIKPGTNTETEYLALLARAGVDRATITEIPVKFDLAPFFARKVDVWPGYESNEALTARSREPDAVLLLSREHGIDTYGNIIITSETMLREHPETVRRFLKAIVHAWRFAAQNPEQAIDILVEAEPKLDRDKEMAGLRAVLPLVLDGQAPADANIGHMTSARWEASKQVLVDAGMDMSACDAGTAFNASFLPTQVQK